MCVLAVFLDALPGLPLAIAANRDESPGRPAEGPRVLAAGIVGGRDLLGGGTWLAINRSGIVVAITNRHRPARTAASWSRGQLVLEAARCTSLG